jgi:hypothetical protein
MAKANRMNEVEGTIRVRSKKEDHESISTKEATVAKIVAEREDVPPGVTALIFTDLASVAASAPTPVREYQDEANTSSRRSQGRILTYSNNDIQLAEEIILSTIGHNARVDLVLIEPTKKRAMRLLSLGRGPNVTFRFYTSTPARMENEDIIINLINIFGTDLIKDMGQIELLPEFTHKHTSNGKEYTFSHDLIKLTRLSREKGEYPPEVHQPQE